MAFATPYFGLPRDGARATFSRLYNQIEDLKASKISYYSSTKSQKKRKMAFKIMDKHDLKEIFKIKSKRLSGRFFGRRHQILESEDEQDRSEFLLSEKSSRYSSKASSPLIPVNFDQVD